ncbi:MAG TPA: hypothetical protein VEW26_06700 [Allosphingosinicella sp.]|nr:hypothetical protein [Allosphingosinicella sp.]
MSIRLIQIAALGVMAALAGCAAAPRAPATSLAEAGIKATASFSAEVRDTQAQLGSLDVGDAFTSTLRQCSNPRLTCKEIVDPAELSDERRQLARVVGLRAQALDALGSAYAALQTEAAYDQGADLSGAAGDAVTAANAFAAEAARLDRGATPAALPGEVASLADFGFGLLGEHLQRKRLLAASREIAKATLQIRNGMTAEAASFHRLTEYLVGERTAARITLMKAGYLSPDDVFKQVAEQLNLNLTVPDPNSESYRMAVQASMRALAQQEVIAVQQRYEAAIATLSALLQSHAQLEKGKALSIANVERVLTRLDASLNVPGPAPRQQAQPQGQGQQQQQQQP